MRNVLVSAVIPAFNARPWLGEAIDSALRQTYRPMEVIVVDDGSTDGTEELLASYGERICVIRQVNRGVSAARNAGIGEASGEWIALLDADDVWHPEKTEVQLRAVSHRDDVGLIGTPPVATIPERLDPEPETRELGVHEFLAWVPMGPSGALARKRCLQAVGGFDEELSGVADRDMWLRLAVRYAVVQVLSPCWWYRPHESQMSRCAERMYRDYRHVVEKFFAEHAAFEPYRELAWSYLYYDAAVAYLGEGRRAAAAGFLLRSLLRRPKPLGSMKRWHRAKLLVRLALGERAFHRLKPART